MATIFLTKGDFDDGRLQDTLQLQANCFRCDQRREAHGKDIVVEDKHGRLLWVVPAKTPTLTTKNAWDSSKVLCASSVPATVAASGQVHSSPGSDTGGSASRHPLTV